MATKKRNAIKNRRMRLRTEKMVVRRVRYLGSMICSVNGIMVRSVRMLRRVSTVVSSSGTAAISPPCMVVVLVRVMIFGG